MNSNPFNISIPVSVTALLFKMRDEIGRLHRDKRKLQQDYDVLVKRTAELQSDLRYVELFPNEVIAVIDDADPNWNEYPHLIKPKSSVE